MSWVDDVVAQARSRAGAAGYGPGVPGYVPGASYDETVGWNLDNMKARSAVALNRGGATSEALGSKYVKQLEDYDPAAAVKQYATGAWNAAYGEVGGVRDQLATLAGKSVGAGRLDTGFFDLDQGDVINRATDSLNANIAQQSVAASGQKLGAIGQLGTYANEERSRYLDLLTGGMNFEQSRKNAEAQRSADLWGGVIKAGGTIAAAAI